MPVDRAGFPFSSRSAENTSSCRANLALRKAIRAAYHLDHFPTRPEPSAPPLCILQDGSRLASAREQQLVHVPEPALQRSGLSLGRRGEGRSEEHTSELQSP